MERGYNGMSVNTGGADQSYIESLQAEIARQDAVIERLGDTKVFKTLYDYEAELSVRIQYARDNRSKPDE